jgi:hypothetical protein
MLSTRDVLLLTELSPPLLTAYVRTDPAAFSNGRGVPGYLTWLRHEGKSLAQDLQPVDEQMFRQQLSRAEAFLSDQRPKQQGLVILAGTKTWKSFPLPLNVVNELHWGKPALAQLLDIVDEQKPSCVVAVDRAGSRFFRYDLGKLTEFEELKFHIDSSQWKRKEHTHMARVATKMPHGPQRDLFKQRMEAQYLRLCHDIAKRVNGLCKKEGLASVFLVGSKRLTEPIEEKLPQKLRQSVTLVPEDLARVSTRSLQEHLASRFAAWAKEDAQRSVDKLIDGGHGSVVGIDETLAHLQSGRISIVVAVRGLEKDLKQCVSCGLVNRSADPVCPACGCERRGVMLSEVLPELLRLKNADIEVVNGVAGRKLSQSGGMGGWLRRAKRGNSNTRAVMEGNAAGTAR